MVPSKTETGKTHLVLEILMDSKELYQPGLSIWSREIIQSVLKALGKAYAPMSSRSISGMSRQPMHAVYRRTSHPSANLG